MGGNLVVGAVGGQKIPPVDRFIAGYGAGIRKANPKIKILVGYSQDFVAQAKCKEKALEQITNGANVIFQVAGGCGLGALQAAKEENVWGIGVDADQAYLGRHILTSALKKVDVAVYSAIIAAKNNGLKTGTNAIFSVKNGGVGYGKVSSRIPAADIKKLNAIRAQIAAGKIRIPTTVK
jgi:basic membrane protein A